jgi:hypothetical protein
MLLFPVQVQQQFEGPLQGPGFGRLRFGRAYVRFLARADVPALRGVLRARGLPPDHPLWLAFVAPAVSPLLSGPFANVFSAVEVQGVRALRERARRHRSEAAAPRGEAGLAALRPRPTRERRHRVCLQWRLWVRIPALPCPAAPLTLPCPCLFQFFGASGHQKLLRTAKCSAFQSAPIKFV